MTPRTPKSPPPTALSPDTPSRGPAVRVWRTPTRRAFVAMIGAAAAALAVRERASAPVVSDDAAPRRWTGTTRWIGHC